MRLNRLMWLSVLILVTACGTGGFLSPALPTLAPEALTVPASSLTSTFTPTPAITNTPIPTLTFTPSVTPAIPIVPTVPTLIPKDAPYPQPCYFNWARQERPELITQIEAELEKNGFTDVTVYASDYGENCISRETNTVQYFAAMTTEFSITIPVEQTELAAINARTFDLMTVFKDIWSDDNPTGGSSQLEFIFVSQSGEVTVLSNYDFLVGLLKEHPDGQNLLDDCTSLETGPNATRLTCRAN